MSKIVSFGIVELFTSLIAYLIGLIVWEGCLGLLSDSDNGEFNHGLLLGCMFGIAIYNVIRECNNNV